MQLHCLCLLNAVIVDDVVDHDVEQLTVVVDISCSAMHILHDSLVQLCLIEHLDRVERRAQIMRKSSVDLIFIVVDLIDSIDVDLVTNIAEDAHY